MKEPGIQYIGIKELTPVERAKLDKLSSEYYPKIQRILRNMISLVVHVKIYQNAGKGKIESPESKRRKFGVHVRAIAPTRIFASTKAHDWDLVTALHKSFREIGNIVKKGVHADEQRPRRISKIKLRNL